MQAFKTWTAISPCPAGTNILDGRYAVFGYVVEGQEVLRDVKVNDVITSIKVISGSDKLVNGGKRSPAPAAELAVVEEAV